MPSRTASSCGGRLPEVACSASGILFRTAELTASMPMGRRSERLSKQGMLASDLAGDGDVIQVVSRAFDVLRCFEGHEARLGNLDISNRCGLPRSTVSRLTHTLTRMGQLVYLPRDQKYRIGPSAVAMSTSMIRGFQLPNLSPLRLQTSPNHLHV